MKYCYRIADCYVEPELNSLTRNGEIFHLEPKMMKVLVEFAHQPNELLTKEYLIQTVWPDTFVSDDVLTRCISTLRRVMGDDIHHPTIIQTIPKSGYRLLAETLAIPKNENHSHHGEGGNRSAPKNATTTHSPLEPPPFIASTAHSSSQELDVAEVSTRLLRRSHWLMLLIAVLTLTLTNVGFSIWHRLAQVKPAWQAQNFRIVPFTSYSGQQTQPAFSPDGNRVAFVWDGGSGKQRSIYIKQLGSETLLRITQQETDATSPVWSPDGTQIAFLAVRDEERGIYLISSLGGAAKKIFTPSSEVEWKNESLSWSPDGKSLVFSDQSRSQESVSIVRLSLESQHTFQLTEPPAGAVGDLAPAYAPDGKNLAFVRALEGAVRDIYVVPADGGQPRQLTFDNRNVDSLAWSTDSKFLYFSSDRGGKFSLWRIPVAGGEAVRLPFGTEDASQPALALKSNRLAYAQGSAIWSILRYPLHASAAPTPDAILSSTQQDSAPAYSPNGSRIAFQSWRSGTQEIWLAGADGSNLQQLTNIERSITGSPRWSPDGSLITFDSRPQGHSHIYVVSASGGAPRQLTNGNYNDILPRFSADGKRLYFTSNRNGGWQIWEIPLAGSTPQQVTQHGGFIAEEAPDGKSLYIARADQSGLWQFDRTTGTETKILDQPLAGYWGYWSLRSKGIYYLNMKRNGAEISLLNLATRNSSRLLSLQHSPPVYSGISIAPDDSALLITDQRDATSHISLIEDFQ